ncbi:MAG: deoxyribonuclease IV, partial [Planctomycetota bacterium]
MPILGAHMSIAGGYHKAVRAAHAAGCDCVQLFTKNNNQWRAKELTEAECEAFQAALAELGVTHPVAHNS